MCGAEQRPALLQLSPAPHLERLGRENVSKQFALRRIGQADDVAKATCYLLSDASGFVTGTCHSVDGGMAMRG